MADAQPKTNKRKTFSRRVRNGGLNQKTAGGTPLKMGLASTMFVAHFMNEIGVVDVERVADAFRMTKSQLAETTGLGAATISKADRRASRRTQTRVTEMLEIISRIADWAGGEAQAMAWYRSQPIPALDGRTSEALVKSGNAGAVREYLDHLALGGFA